MTIKEFAISLREELRKEQNPVKIAEKINNRNFTDKQKEEIILYLQGNERSTEGDNSAFLKLVSEVKKRVIGDK